MASSGSSQAHAETISPPYHFNVHPNAIPRKRLNCLLQNYVNQPSLMDTPHTGTLFSACPSENVHFTYTLTLGNPLHNQFFQVAHLDTFPSMHHIDIAIKTAVRYTGAENPGHIRYAHVIEGTCYDRDGKPLSAIGNEGETIPFYLSLEYGGTQGTAHGDVSARYRELYTWKCVVEYIKIFAKLVWFGGKASNDPLKGLGLLGNRPSELRRIEEGGNSWPI